MYWINWPIRRYHCQLRLASGWWRPGPALRAAVKVQIGLCGWLPGKDATRLCSPVEQDFSRYLYSIERDIG